MMKEKIPSGYKKGQLNNFTPEQMALHEICFPMQNQIVIYLV